MNEGDGTIEVCAGQTSRVTLGRIVNLTLSTEDGKATSVVPRDFTAVSLPLQIDMTQPKACINVTIDDDSIVEDAESFRVVVSSSDPNVDIMNSITIVTIEDNDKVVIGFETDRYHGKEGQRAIVCVIVKEAVSLERRVLVQLSSNDRTAAGVKTTLMCMWDNFAR